MLHSVHVLYSLFYLEAACYKAQSVTKSKMTELLKFHKSDTRMEMIMINEKVILNHFRIVGTTD